jgi:hypothetical protein
MTQTTEYAPPTREDLRKHLDFIQALVSRMSAASSSSKGWLLPVATAAYGFALTKHSGSVGLLGVFAVLVFSYIDANYLKQERAYRALYNAVIKGDGSVPLYSLNPVDSPEVESSSKPQGALTIVKRWVPGWRVWTSWSIAPFYGSLLILGVGVFIYAIIT